MFGIASFIQRQTRLILWVSALLTIAGGIYAVKLYQNLRTDLEELLPLTSRSVIDLNQVTRRLQSIDNLAVLVFSKDTQGSKRFVIDLAKKLEKLPKSEVAMVEYRIDRELEFFKKRLALFMEKEDLVKIRDYVREKLRYEKALYNPLNIFSGQEIPEPILDFDSMRKKYDGKSNAYANFPGGFFATKDETKRVVLIDVPGKALGIEGVKKLKTKVADIISSLNPQSYAKDLEIHYTGSVQEMLEEQEALVEDLAISTIAVLLLVSLSMHVFFRKLSYTTVLTVSLLCGTVWTFGLSYFIVGYLNANSAFLGGIVLGNGINFGIIFLARYTEERRAGHSSLRAVRIAIFTTWKATITAALAAGLSYGSLMLTSFRGFQQFGAIGLIGMVFCWVGTYTTLPALIAVVDRKRESKKNSRKKEVTQDVVPAHKAYLMDALAAWISKHPVKISLVSATVTVVSLLLLTLASKDLLETNLENLRSKTSAEHGAGYYTKYLNEIFQRFLTPMVVLPTSQEKAREIAKRLNDLKKSQGPNSFIVNVQTIDDFVPRDQKEKIQILRDIQSQLTPAIQRRLSKEEKDKVSMMLNPEVFNPFKVTDLPPLVREKFKESNGSIGNLVLVEPPLTKEIWRGENLEKFVDEIRETADSVEKNAPVAGGMAITADLVSSISRDGPLATLLAFLSATILVIILFKVPRVWGLALLALMLGVAWFAGSIIVLSVFGLKINFLNFVALPITFGIGVDYGVNVFQRFNQQRKVDILKIIRETGGAVGLCSVTTVIGYASLLIASNQGFVSFGLLAVLGEATCIIAALITLPAFLLTMDKWKVARASGRAVKDLIQDLPTADFEEGTPQKVKVAMNQDRSNR